MNFQDQFYSIEATEEPGCILSLRIKASPDVVQKAHKKAIKNINKNVSTPGYRKGKSPDEIVLKKYGSFVEREWKEVLLNEVIHAAINLTKISPMNEKSVRQAKIEQCSLEDGAVVVVSYEHLPQVPSLDFSKIPAPNVEKKNISQEDIDRVTKSIQTNHADYEKITDRPSQEGDYVELTIESIEQEGQPSRVLLKDRRFCVDETMPVWLKDLCLGLSTGETRVGTALLSGDAGASMEVKVTLNSLSHIILPPLNDELAKKVGASSVADLLEKIRHNLSRANEDEYIEKCFAEIEASMLSLFPFDLPATLIELEQKQRLEKAFQQMQMESLSDQERNEREQAIMQEVRTASEESLRHYFLERKILEQANLRLSKKELDEEIQKEISADPAFYYYQQQQKVPLNTITSRLISSIHKKKLREYVLQQVLPQS